MNLRHFSNVAAVALEGRTYAQERPGMKPTGFWVSDESDETSWSSWCRDNSYDLGKNEFAVTLADDAKILTLEGPDALLAFHREFTNGDNWCIDWPTLADRWQGIIITPYLWSLRMDREINWYYSWDCASGCIWDLSAIASVELVAASSLAEAVQS